MYGFNYLINKTWDFHFYCFLFFSRLGNLGELTKEGGLHQFLLDNHRKFGAIFSFFWGKELTVSIASPPLFRDVQTLFDRPGNVRL